MSIQCAYPYDGPANQRTLGNLIQRQKGERDRDRQLDRKIERECRCIDVKLKYDTFFVCVDPLV